MTSVSLGTFDFSLVQGRYESWEVLRVQDVSFSVSGNCRVHRDVLGGGCRRTGSAGGSERGSEWDKVCDRRNDVGFVLSVSGVSPGHVARVTDLVRGEGRRGREWRMSSNSRQWTSGPTRTGRVTLG